MRCSTIFSVASFSVLLPTLSGYKIDQSCTDKGIENDVWNAMTSAFMMVDAAVGHLSADPLDHDTVELLGFLFAKDGVDTRQLAAKDGLEKTKQVLRNIGYRYRDEIVRDALLGISDMTIFCHLDHFKLINGQKILYRDESNGSVLKLNEQRYKGTTMDRIALAVKTNPLTSSGTYAQTQIQLCPWFVDWIKSHKFKLHNDVARSNIGREVIKMAESNRFGLRQIDAFSLLDKVLLHEMTHARAAFSGLVGKNARHQDGLENVKSANGFLAFFGWAAYGWTGARQLARNGDNLGEEKAPDNNADTIALFASVCKLLDDTNNPRKVDNEGRIIGRGTRA